MTIEVSGLDEFDIDDFSNELDDAKKLLELGIGSETLKKQVFKKLAFKYLCDARQEVKNQVAEEIDAAVESGRRNRSSDDGTAEAMDDREAYGRHRRSGDRAAGDSGVRATEQAKTSRLTRRSCRKSGSGESNWSAG